MNMKALAKAYKAEREGNEKRPAAQSSGIPSPLGQYIPIGLLDPWHWVQPSNDEILPRLRDAFELNVPARERENMCRVAHGEITALRADITRLKAALQDCKVQTWSNQAEGFEAAEYMRQTARAALGAPK